MFTNKSKKLLDFSDESEGENGEQEKGKSNELKINKSYAQNYEKWRCNEEAAKLKARYGEDILDEEDSESSSSDDSDIHDEEREKEFLRTLSLLKRKDAVIYDGSSKFFAEKDKTSDTQKSETNGNTNSKASKKDKKPYLLKDHDREMILRNEANEFNEDDSEEVSKPKQDLPYNQELSNLKRGFSEVLNEIDSDEENDELLRKRVVTVAEKEKEDSDYRSWLKGQMENLDEKSSKGVKEMQYLKEIWSSPTLPEDEKFLRDYILNRGYDDPQEAEKDDYIPTYDEIIHDSDEGGLSGDENFETKREDFEHKYNFRYEEPDQEFIKRYPRTVAESLRRADEKRKKQREVVKEKRKSKKARKREEIQRLKSMKRKEILEKLQKLQEITGDPNLPVDDADIDGDFDPEEHDRRMKQLFNDNYYENGDEGKPVFPPDEELDDINWEEWVPEGDNEVEPEADSTRNKKKKKKYDDQLADCENPEFNMDAEFEEPSTSNAKTKKTVVNELIEASKGKGRRKTKSSAFMTALERKKPKFDPSVHDSYQEYFDEYYQLDFEDLVGDMPCRFKYRKVTPNDFGLTTEEILNAEDQELNQWASVKKTFQYRAPDEELYELQAYKKKATDLKRKKRVLASLYTPKENESEEDVKQEVETGESSKSKRKRKKNKKKAKNGSEVETSELIEKINEEPLLEIKEEPLLEVKEEPLLEVKEQPLLEVKEEPQEEDKEESVQKLKNKFENNANSNESKKSKKKAKKRERELQKGNTEESTINTNSKITVPNVGAKEPIPKSRKEKRRQTVTPKQIPNVPVDDERLMAYGINPKKFKKRMIYGTGAN